eukprot:GDKJ01014016.1.p1 GENE.GDKJ01014016.1~~GDKJ01014016.1.p1  ORF type:complete len:265 (+),score=42.94 GDKJ01014016.1:37-831(+)
MRWEVSTEEAVTSLLRSAQEDTGLEDVACACAVCQARTTPQWRFVERQRVCNRCFMKLRKGSWNRHPSTILEEYCSVMGYDPMNATRIGKFFCCPEDEPPPSPAPANLKEKTKICVMLIEEDVVSLPGLSWSKSNQAWRSSYLDLDTGEIKFQYFPVDKSQNLSEEVQRIRVFDFKMRNVEEAKAWRKQFGYSAKVNIKANVHNQTTNHQSHTQMLPNVGLSAVDAVHRPPQHDNETIRHAKAAKHEEGEAPNLEVNMEEFPED